jgi:hypothetical protein
MRGRLFVDSMNYITVITSQAHELFKISTTHIGVHIPLFEPMPDVCALLLMSLSSLPEPVLRSTLFEALVGG